MKLRNWALGAALVACDVATSAEDTTGQGGEQPKKLSAFDLLRQMQGTTNERFATRLAVKETTTKKGSSGVKAASQGKALKVLPWLVDRENLGKTPHKLAQGFSVLEWQGRFYVCHLAVIEPDVALYLLNTHNKHGKGGNRPMSPSLVKEYATDMTDGSWGFSANQLTFVEHETDFDATVGDAQHQLSAIVASGKAQLFVVTYGISEAYADYINGGKARSPANVVARHGRFDDYIPEWEKLGLTPAQIVTLTKQHEKVFSELVRTVALRRLGLTVRGSSTDLKKKHVFKAHESLYETSTLCVADVVALNTITRGSKETKTGKIVPDGKGRLEVLAQLAYWASTMYLISCDFVQTDEADPHPLHGSITVDPATMQLVHAFYEDVADTNVNEKNMDGSLEQTSKVNATRLRWFLEQIANGKAEIAGASNNSLMARFTAIMVAVLRTVNNEEFTSADVVAIRTNPSNIIRVGGLDDFEARAIKEMDEDETNEDDESVNEDEDETTEETNEDEDTEEVNEDE